MSKSSRKNTGAASGETLSADAAKTAAPEATDEKPVKVAPAVAGEILPNEDAVGSGKVTVKTTGSFQLIDPNTRSVIPADNSEVEVLMTGFIKSRLENGQLEAV